jgi:hypothetical protein
MTSDIYPELSGSMTGRKTKAVVLRYQSDLKLFVSSIVYFTMLDDSALENFVVSPVKLVIREMRIALCDLDAGMTGKLLRQF